MTTTVVVNLYLTKDYGQTWTDVGIYNLPSPTPGLVYNEAIPTNTTYSNYPVNEGVGYTNQDKYNVALTVDANNPNIVYLGGTANGNQSGMIRINVTDISDSHSVFAYNGVGNSAGLQINTTGGTTVVNNQFEPSEFIGTTAGLSDEPGAYLNLLTDPSNPFNTNATLEVFNVASFVNNGSGVTWIPEDTILQATAGLSVANNINVPSEYDNYELTVPSTNVHQIVSFTDPLTGDTRLIVADDQGVFTGVINADGSINYGPGVTTNADGTVDSSDDPNGASPTFSRNGNLAIAQVDSGASQASLAAITNQVTTLFYANGPNLGQVLLQQSDSQQRRHGLHR